MLSGGFSNPSVGYSAELYVPSTGQHCQLPDLEYWRRGHSMEERTVCGGEFSETQTSCLSLTAEGTWERTTTLLEER